MYIEIPHFFHRMSTRDDSSKDSIWNLNITSASIELEYCSTSWYSAITEITGPGADSGSSVRFGCESENLLNVKRRRQMEYKFAMSKEVRPVFLVSIL